MIVRAVPGATLFVNGIAVIQFPPATRQSVGQLAPAQRLDRSVDIDGRTLVSGVNVAAIAYPTG
jgi:hypothetical protein